MVIWTNEDLGRRTFEREATTNHGEAAENGARARHGFQLRSAENVSLIFELISPFGVLGVAFGNHRLLCCASTFPND